MVMLALGKKKYSTELDRHAGTRDTVQSLIDMLALEIQYRA